MNKGYTMSDKAKGKQRAYPIYIPTNGRPDDTLNQSTIPVIIRFADDSPDLSLEIPPDTTVSSVADVILKSRPQFAGKQIKLIHAGKMLFEYTPLSSLRTNRSPTSPRSQEQPSRISTSDRNVFDKGKRRESIQEPSPIWLHCSASDPKSEDSDSSPDQVVQYSNLLLWSFVTRLASLRQTSLQHMIDSRMQAYLDMT
ncbi:hypothetical protein FS842_001098 [Serendipita sp. 407]|nr:hypothetical protein FS842_001098 [Serendipita sp. 407]